MIKFEISIKNFGLGGYNGFKVTPAKNSIWIYKVYVFIFRWQDEGNNYDFEENSENEESQGKNPEI